MTAAEHNNIAGHALVPPMDIHYYDEKDTPSMQEDFYYNIQLGDHQTHRCGARDCQGSHHSHPRACRFLHLALFVLFGLFTFLSLHCIYDLRELFSGIGVGSSGTGSEIVQGLFRRAGEVAAATGASSSNGNMLVSRKYYLIIIFVGLLGVAILGVMLSAWCCKGSFRNPLCCPCYLCACCGGLACLECIGCGLCAEGLDQV